MRFGGQRSAIARGTAGDQVWASAGIRLPGLHPAEARIRTELGSTSTDHSTSPPPRARQRAGELAQHGAESAYERHRGGWDGRVVGTEAILHRGRGIVNRVCRVVGGHYRRLGKSNLVIRLNRGLTLRGQIIFPGGLAVTQTCRGWSWSAISLTDWSGIRKQFTDVARLEISHDPHALHQNG